MSKEFDERKRENFLAYLESSGELDDIGFDLYACDPQDFPELNNALVDFHMISAGGSCPFQAEGYMNGYPFYLRSGDDYTSLKVAANKDDVYCSPLWASRMDGEITPSNLTTVFLYLVHHLERADYCFHFEGHKWKREEGQIVSDTNSWDEYPSRGMTASEAYDNLYEPHEWTLEILKLTAEEYVALRKSQNFQRTPVVDDDRVFPETMPTFLR